MLLFRRKVAGLAGPYAAIVGGPARSPFDDSWDEQVVKQAKAYHDNDAIDTNEQGGKQSHLEHRMDLLVPEMLLRVSHVLHVGAEKYGDENWHNIPNWRHHIGRAMYHCVKALQGAQDEDHMANAICRVMFAMWHRDHYQEPIYQDWGVPDNRGTGVK